MPVLFWRTLPDLGALLYFRVLAVWGWRIRESRCRVFHKSSWDLNLWSRSQWTPRNTLKKEGKTYNSINPILRFDDGAVTFRNIYSLSRNIRQTPFEESSIIKQSNRHYETHNFESCSTLNRCESLQSLLDTMQVDQFPLHLKWVTETHRNDNSLNSIQRSDNDTETFWGKSGRPRSKRAQL